MGVPWVGFWPDPAHNSIMAMDKGKSRRRIKDWQQRLQDGEADDAAPQRESLAVRAVKIPAHRLAAPQDNLDDLPKTDGMVVGFFPGGSIVRTEAGPMLCGIAKTFRAPEGSTALTVGDDVTVAITQHADGQVETDKDRTDGVIIARGPRETALVRPQPTSGKYQDIYKADTFQKIIVANMDRVMIVTCMRHPKFRRGLIDRFLIAAQRGDLNPLLVINKIDLTRPDDDLVADLSASGLEVLLCSAETGEGLEDLARALAGATVVLAGASGVGKSTLINALIPGTDALTRKVRSKDKRGRHTTSAAVVYDLPGGGTVVDTPGIRELGTALTAQELPWYFPEFEPFIPQCRFNDCTHTHEPDCAILAAVDDGQIDENRYDSYLRILETL
jgi:ribosome biogenesis GTPase / thiamine phosphate phosphatase